MISPIRLYQCCDQCHYVDEGIQRAANYCRQDEHRVSGVQLYCYTEEGLLTIEVVEGIRLSHKVYRCLITLCLVPCLSLIPQL